MSDWLVEFFATRSTSLRDLEIPVGQEPFPRPGVTARGYGPDHINGVLSESMIRFSIWLTPEAGGKVDRERPT